jgi:hypothetical protein
LLLIVECVRLVAVFCAFKTHVEDTPFTEDVGDDLEDSYAQPGKLTESIIADSRQEPAALLVAAVSGCD